MRVFNFKGWVLLEESSLDSYNPHHNVSLSLYFIVTAFTIERYVAICHPFLSHTMSKLSRAIKFIFLIWILSIFFATPLAIQTGIVTDPSNHESSWCSIVPERVLIEDSFVVATILFFFAPMTLISVLYMLIGMKLRSSTLIKRENGNVVRNNNLQSNVQNTTSQSTKRVIKMLGKWRFFQFQSKVMLTDELVMFMALIESRTHEIITKKLRRITKKIVKLSTKIIIFLWCSLMKNCRKINYFHT